MAFSFLPLSVGDTIADFQFNEARSAVLERGDTVGFVFSNLPATVSTGTVLDASTSLKQINGLRESIEDLVRAQIAYINPTTEKQWFDPFGVEAPDNLNDFFAAAGIGDGTNWTRVPARKGGLTVSDRLVTGDTVFVEHINEIRLAVLILLRIRFASRAAGFSGLIRGPVSVSTGAVWTTERAAAIAGAQSPLISGSFGGQLGFRGIGSIAPGPFTANVRIDQRVSGIGFQGGREPTGTAPTPFSYASATAFAKHVGAAPIFFGAPPPTNARRIGYNIPSSAGVPSAFNFGVTWFSVTPTLADETFTVTGIAVAGLPTGAGASPDNFATQLSIGLADTTVDRTGWPAPAPSSSSEQRANVAVLNIHANITNFVFQ